MKSFKRLFASFIAISLIGITVKAAEVILATAVVFAVIGATLVLSDVRKADAYNEAIAWNPSQPLSPLLKEVVNSIREGSESDRESQETISKLSDAELVSYYQQYYEQQQQ